MSMINGSHDFPNYLDISRSLCGMHVKSTTAVSCSLTTSSLESLPNDSEKPNQPKRLLFPKCNYGKISVKTACIQYSIKHKSNSLYNEAV